MEPSGIHLTRQYPITDDLPDRDEHWGEQLWRLLAAEVALVIPTAVVDREAYDFVRLRLVDHLLSRLVIKADRAFSEMRGLDEDTVLEALRVIIDDTVSIAASQADRAAWLLIRVCRRALGWGAVATKAQRRAIEKLAFDRAHGCYLCGSDLVYRDSPEEEREHAGGRYFEVDHLFPKSRGGGRSKHNLAAVCEACNKLKDHYLCYADSFVEGMMTQSDRPEMVRRAFERRPLFSLIWRQKGECGRCFRPFYDASDKRLYLFRRDMSDAYHFMNIDVVCGDCEADPTTTEGVLIRD